MASKYPQTKNDLLTYADSFTLAKWLIKHEAIAGGFTSNFIPGEASALSLELGLKPYNALRRLHLYLPSVHSIRKVCSEKDLAVSLEKML